MPKLIVIRGPSGSGKSTLSNELLKRAKQPLLLVGGAARGLKSQHSTM